MNKKIEKTNESRRSFIKKAGAIAVTAPAAGLILNAVSTPALAQVASGQTPPPPAPTPQP